MAAAVPAVRVHPGQLVPDVVSVLMLIDGKELIFTGSDSNKNTKSREDRNVLFSPLFAGFSRFYNIVTEK